MIYGRNTDLSIVGICCCWNQETIGELDSLVSLDPDHQGAVAGCQDCEVLRWLEARAVVTVDGGDGGVCLAAAVEGVLHPGGGVGEQGPAAQHRHVVVVGVLRVVVTLRPRAHVLRMRQPAVT